jgi:hypothetical protein
MRRNTKQNEGVPRNLCSGKSRMYGNHSTPGPGLLVGDTPNTGLHTIASPNLMTAENGNLVPIGMVH